MEHQTGQNWKIEWQHVRRTVPKGLVHEFLTYLLVSFNFPQTDIIVQRQPHHCCILHFTIHRSWILTPHPLPLPDLIKKRKEKKRNLETKSTIYYPANKTLKDLTNLYFVDLSEVHISQHLPQSFVSALKLIQLLYQHLSLSCQQCGVCSRHALVLSVGMVQEISGHYKYQQQNTTMGHEPCTF